MTEASSTLALPPYADFLGLTAMCDADGVLLTMPPGDQLLGRPGYLHGGALAGLLEIAAVAAVRAAIGPDRGLKPVTVTVDYMRGGLARPTHARGRIVRLGGRVANVEASAWQDDPARPIATARMNLLLADA